MVKERDCSRLARRLDKRPCMRVRGFPIFVIAFDEEVEIEAAGTGIRISKQEQRPRTYSSC